MLNIGVIISLCHSNYDTLIKIYQNCNSEEENREVVE